MILIGHFGVRRGLEIILSHMAPSCLNMSSYRAIWTHFRSKSTTNQNPETRICELPDFRKLCAAKMHAEAYRRNLMGPNFHKHLLFQFKVHDKVHNNLDSRRVPGFMMSSWMHDEFLDSRWVPGFTMGSWYCARHGTEICGAAQIHQILARQNTGRP